jgi:putative restriction endonuclease
MDLAERNEIRGTTLALTPELASRFITYWSIVAHRRSHGPDVRLPFHHLSSDGIWTSLDADGKPSPSRNSTRFAELPSDFLRFLNDPADRDKARHLLIAKYFTESERIALYEAIGLEVPTELAIEQHASYKSAYEAKRIGREARFRTGVLAAYDYTCALTGHRLVTVSGASIVDAAHIHQFASSQNNDLANGIALSKTAHWLFDQGLWTISDEYRVIVSVGAFNESAPTDALLLAIRHGSRLLLPKDNGLWPNPIHLGWHRSQRFVGH